MCSFRTSAILFGVLALVLGAWIHPYIVFLCKFSYFLPIVQPFCSNPVPIPDRPIVIPPINAIATETARLVSGLSQVEISAPTRFVTVQTIAMDIQGRVEVSDMDSMLKSQLKTHLTEFDLLLEMAIDNLIEMQTTFVSGIDNLQIYTEQTLSGISKIIDGRKPLFGFKRVGNDTF